MNPTQIYQKEMGRLNELKLSNESKAFLENLRLYLFSSGKNSDEIEEVVEELKVHLLEAEKNGKPINKIIGKSPKEYMEMVSKEMSIDFRSWIQYICLIIFGSFSFTIFPDLLEGNLSYSVLEIVGYIVIGTIFIISIFGGFKYISTTNQPSKIQGIILFIIMLLPLFLFIGLIYLNHTIHTPIIHFGNTASVIIGVITALFIIGMSIWSKTWIFIISLGLLIVPEYVLSFTPLKYETQLIISTLITFAGFSIYLWVSNKIAKN